MSASSEALKEILHSFRPQIKRIERIWAARELALKHKVGRTGREAEGLCHHDWGFPGFG